MTVDYLIDADRMLASALTRGASIRPQSKTQFKFTGRAVRPIDLVKPADFVSAGPVINRASNGKNENAQAPRTFAQR